MRFVAFAVRPGESVRRLLDAASAEEAIAAARPLLARGEALSVNRANVPEPTTRASEVLAGVGEPCTKDERRKKNSSAHFADLAGARWAKKQKRLT